MHRVLIPPSAIHKDQITVTDSRALHHLVRVLRAKPGETLECFDGAGRGYRGPITKASPAEVVMTIAQRREEPVPRVALTLAQALIQPERFEWAIQKATELGVARILPLVCARSVSQKGGASDQRLARWRRIAEEAATQCGRCTIPILEAPRSFHEAAGEHGSDLTLLLTLAEPGVPLREITPQLGQRVAGAMIMIGPEGDFTPEEVALAKRFGARIVSLGPRALRAETAAIAALAIIQDAVGMV